MMSIFGGIFMLGFTYGWIIKPLLETVYEDKELDDLISSYGKEER